MQRVDYKGSLHVYFLRNCIFPPPLERAHDARPHISFVYNHTPHEGRSAYGVPPILCQWIQNNCRRTAYDTWENLMSAIEAGEFAGLPENTYYSQRHVAYWHRKTQVQRFATISADSCVNMEALLKQDEKVGKSVYVDLTFRIRQYLYGQSLASISSGSFMSISQSTCRKSKKSSSMPHIMSAKRMLTFMQSSWMSLAPVFQSPL